MKAVLASLAIFISLFGLSRADDILFPSNNGIIINYNVSSYELTTDDTLMIEFMISNNENHAFEGLFLTEILPGEFQVISQNISVNGQSISGYEYTFQASRLFSGYNEYHWVIDDPHSDRVNRLLYPEQYMILTIKAIPQSAGQFRLPFHTVCFYSNQISFFLLSDILTISVEQSASPGNLAGRALNYQAEPIANMLFRIDASLFDYTSDAGYYSIAQIPPGIYDIRVTHPEEGDSVIEDITINSSMETKLNIIWPDDNINGLDYEPGDINGDNTVIGSDVTYGVNYFRGIGSPPPDSFWSSTSNRWIYSAADANGDCMFIGSDITFIVNYFRAIHEYIRWCPLTPPNNR